MLKIMKHYTKILLWVGLAAIFFIPFLWYIPGHIIIGGDLTFPLNPFQYFLTIFHIWREVYTGQPTANSLPTLSFYAPMAFFDLFPLSLQTVQKLHFGFWLAAPAVSMFYLMGVLFRNHPKKLIAQLIGVAVYIFNTYQVVWVDSSRMTVWLGLPLILAFLIQGLEDKKQWWRWSAGIALASIVTSTAATNPPVYLVFLGVLFLYLLYHFITHNEDRNWRGVGRIALFFVTTIILAILVNLYWVLPYAKFLVQQYSSTLTSGIGSINLQNWLDPISTNTSLLNVFRLQGAWDWYSGWGGEAYVPTAATYQRNIFYLFWSVFVPVLAFSALLNKDKRVKNSLIIFFIFLALLGLLFSAGSHLPTGKLYTWMVAHLPLFSIYRSPWYKFTIWTSLGYSILVAISFVNLSEWIESRNLKPASAKVLITVLVGLFIALNTVYTSGLVLGKVFPKKEERIKLGVAHVQFPEHVFKSAEWINKQTDDFRILQLPAQPTFNYTWGLQTLMDMTIFTFDKATIWPPEQIGGGVAAAGPESLAKQAMDDLYFGKNVHLSHLLGLLKVKYLLQKDDIIYDYYGSTDSPAFVKNQIAQYKFPLAHSEGPWSFYEVDKEDQHPLIYPTRQIVYTSPANRGFIQAVYSDLFDKTVTYAQADQETVASKAFNHSHYIAGDTTTARLVDNQLEMDITVPSEGDYSFSYSAQTDGLVFLDGKKIDFARNNDQATSPTMHLTAGKHKLTVTPPQDIENLVENPSFETGLWELPIDATAFRSGTKSFSGQLVNDATDGKQSVQLTSQSHTAAIRHGIDKFDVKSSYLVSFDYKWNHGRAPSYAMWQENHGANPAGRLETKNSWTHFSTIFTPAPQSKGATLFLYADPGDDSTPGAPNIETQVQYDNVKIVKFPPLLDSLALVDQPASTTQATPTVTFKKHSTTHYTVEVVNATGQFILNFLEQFDPGWQARIDNKLVATNHHFRAFGYANGWQIDKTGTYTIDLSFAPQTTFQAAATVSFLAIIFTLGLIFYRRRKK